MQENIESERTRKIAMLIDGDNAQPTLISNMLAETGKYGQVTIRRIYGDWTTANMSGWKDTLQANAIQPIQQFRYTIGKNATDSAMIIDCMDIVYEGIVDGFCLVSSDSDYTRLATRIREKGVFVMGIGKKMTPRAFVSACDVFVYSENLLPDAEFNRLSQAKKNEPNGDAPPPDLVPLLRRGFDLAVQDDGWAFLGVMGQHLRRLDPSFDPRTYGYRQLSHLIKAQSSIFKMRVAKEAKGTAIISVTLKENGD